MRAHAHTCIGMGGRACEYSTLVVSCWCWLHQHILAHCQCHYCTLKSHCQWCETGPNWHWSPYTALCCVSAFMCMIEWEGGVQDNVYGRQRECKIVCMIKREKVQKQMSTHNRKSLSSCLSILRIRTHFRARVLQRFTEVMGKGNKECHTSVKVFCSWQ